MKHIIKEKPRTEVEIEKHSLCTMRVELALKMVKATAERRRISNKITEKWSEHKTEEYTGILTREQGWLEN